MLKKNIKELEHILGLIESNKPEPSTTFPKKRGQNDQSDSSKDAKRKKSSTPAFTASFPGSTNIKMYTVNAVDKVLFYLFYFDIYRMTTIILILSMQLENMITFIVF